ncbi:MAG: hypothetical protein RL088_1813 [Verrucomicrobiota bacterium]
MLEKLRNAARDVAMNAKPTSHAGRRRGASLVVRFSITASIVVVLAMAVLGWFNFQGAKEHLTETWRQSLEHERRTVALKCGSLAADVVRDSLYLARSQSVIDFLRDRNGTTRSRVEADFRALMAGKPGYVQVRIIATDSVGMELVRLDRSGDAVTAMPEERLQPKGDRDYVRDGARLGEGDVYLSEIDLNRDFGGISKPYTPTMRAVAMTVGPVPALVVINVDLTRFLADLQAQRAERMRLYVANEAGSWLVHPVPDARFGVDLGHNWNALRPSPEDRREFGNDWVFSEGRHVLVPETKRELLIRVSSAGGAELDGLRSARNKALVISGSAAAAGILVLVALARWTTRRLRTVAVAIADFDAGAVPHPLPETSGDEVGMLAAGFNAMSQKIAAQVAAVESARAEAVDASRAKEQFLAVMSHEIRTPLNAVTGLLRLLEGNNPPPHQIPVLRSLNAAAQQLTALFNGVLDWSKLRAGKMEVYMEPFPLRRVLGDVALVHRPLAAQKGLEFIEDIADDVPEFAIGDATRLSQVLHNLLNNAVKFTSAGCVALKARWVNGRLHGEVSDTGIGVVEADRVRIFSPFDQTSGSQRFGGTGLGLSITKTILELQGGGIRVEQNEPHGSRFLFELPCEPASTPAGGDASDTVRLDGMRILYVEDTPSNREVMAALIAETGAVLEMAETGGDGIARLRAAEFDVALFDLQLPDMTGIELAREALKLCPALPVFAVTAQLSDEARAECLRVGMRGAVAKPIVPAILFAALKSGGAHAASPAIRATPLHELFRGEKLAQVLTAISAELRKAVVEVTNAVAARDSDAVRKLRHRLHSAIAQLQLSAVNASFERIIAAEWAALDDCVAALHAAAAQCDDGASAKHG